jgi:hypothetical protein
MSSFGDECPTDAVRRQPFPSSLLHVNATEPWTANEDKVLLMLLKDLYAKWGRRHRFPTAGARTPSRIGHLGPCAIDAGEMDCSRSRIKALRGDLQSAAPAPGGSLSTKYRMMLISATCVAEPLKTSWANRIASRQSAVP